MCICLCLSLIYSLQQTHVSNRKRKEIAKKERKERKLKQRQTDKKDNIESVDDPMNSLLI